MAAVHAEAVELKPVRLDDEPILGRHFLLEPLDFAIFELHNLSAARTDQVIMVSLMGDVVVLGLRTEMSCLRDACLAKEIQCAIDGRQAEMRVLFRELVVHRLGGDVFLAKESRQDEFSLAGQLQLMLRQVLAEGIHFFVSFSHDRTGCVSAPLKTKEPQLVKGRCFSGGHERVAELNCVERVRLA